MEMKQRFFGEGKHLNDEGTALYVDALKLNTVEQLPPEVRDHVADCQECKRQITGLFALLDDIDYSDVRSHPMFGLAPERISRVPIILKLAAVVAGVAIVATLTYFLGPFRQGRDAGETTLGMSGHSTDSALKVQHPDTVTRTVERLDFAANFEVNPEFEDLVDGQTRSEGISVMGPRNGSVLGPDAEFSWKGAGVKPHTLSIINNKGETVVTESGAPARFVLKQKLNPGLYYWKIESDSELLYVGKFFVK